MLSPKKLIMIYTFKLFRSRSPSQQRRIARLSLLQVASGVWGLLQTTAGLATNSFFLFPFSKKNQICLEGKNEWPLFGEILLSSVSPSNSEPWRAFWTDPAPFNLPRALLLELQTNKDTVRCVVLGVVVPGHHQKQLRGKPCTFADADALFRMILDCEKSTELNLVIDQTWQQIGQPVGSPSGDGDLRRIFAKDIIF